LDPILGGDLLGQLFFASLGRRQILNGALCLLKGAERGFLEVLRDLLGMVGEVFQEDVAVREVALHAPTEARVRKVP
jgi:hypothetical protein